MAVDRWNEICDFCNEESILKDTSCDIKYCREHMYLNPEGCEFFKECGRAMEYLLKKPLSRK